MIFLTGFVAFLDCSSVESIDGVHKKLDIQHGRHQKKVTASNQQEQNNEIQIVRSTGKKLTSPLITVLDKAVQFRPEIMLKMQMAVGRSGQVLEKLDTKAILTPEAKKAYLEGILHHVAVFFSEMSQHSGRVVPLIRESLFGTVDHVEGQHSFLLEYFEVVSTVGSQDTLLTYLIQKINTTAQLKTFCEQTKVFFTDVYESLSHEAKTAVDKFKKQLQEAAEQARKQVKK